MALQKAPPYTVEQYLEMEAESPEKHEFRCGEIVTMPSVNPDHVRITTDLAAWVGNLLRDGPCEEFVSQMRVRTAWDGLYTYPDLSAVCGDAEFDGETLTNPTLIVEVLSPSSEHYDRGEKFLQYQRIDTLREYVIVYQDRPRIDTYTRGEGASWSYVPVEGLDGSARLHSIGCDLPLAEVYRRVSFGEAQA